jgi:opacity protein-like surface antigen
MKSILAISVAIACLTGVAARAQDDDADGAQDDEFARSGWYLGAYGVYAFEAYRGTGLLDLDDSFGANFRIGYRGYEWLALEADIEWIRNFESHSPWGNGKIRTLTGGVNAKLFPLSGRFQPYGLVGVNGMYVSVKDSPPGFDDDVTDFAFRFGLGLDIYATRNVVLSLEGSYVWGVGDVRDRDYASTGAGILFRF